MVRNLSIECIIYYMSLSNSKLISQLREMDEYEFEHFVADLWELNGWDTTVTSGSSDQGIDIIVEKSGLFPQKGFIQVKRYAKENKIGPSAVQQYSSLRHQKDNVDFIIILTTSSFTSGAKRTADELNIKLFDSSDLLNMISDGDSDSLLRQYIGLEENKSNEKKLDKQDKIKEDIHNWINEKEPKNDLSESKKSRLSRQPKNETSQLESSREGRSRSTHMYKTPSRYVSTKEQQDKEYRDAAIIATLVTFAFLYIFYL